jgi:GTP-binding protein
MSGLVAIVGRPNVGKSALFNRLVGRRIAIVHDQPGVTRDRVTAEAEWRGNPYTLIDTGGIGLLRRERSEDVITNAALHQVELAMEAAQVILLVVNVQDGVVPLDEEVARRLRRFDKPVLVVVNKVDHGGVTELAPDFSRLGFPQLFPVSAIHGRGMDALQDAVQDLLKKAMPPDSQGGTSAEGADAEHEEFSDESPVETRGTRRKAPKAPRVPGMDGEPVRIAIVGRPNVGKSSLINKLTGSDRVVVSPIPGTTRDAVDVPFEVVTEGARQSYVLIDTAGVRKSRRMTDFVEIFSVERTRDAIQRSDITVLVLDAEAGILEQDKKIADLITEAKRACVVIVNKWDLLATEVQAARAEIDEKLSAAGTDRYGRPRQLTTLAEFGEWVQTKLFFLDYAPVIFTSAKNGFQLERFLEAIRFVAGQLRLKIPTAILNRTLQDAIERRQPVSNLGHRLKFYYATQVRSAPPTFLMFVNRQELFSPQYEKYLSDQLRRAFGFEGCPVVLIPRARPKTIESVRRPSNRAGTKGSKSTTSSAESGSRRSVRSTTQKDSPQRSERKSTARNPESTARTRSDAERPASRSKIQSGFRNRSTRPSGTRQEQEEGMNSPTSRPAPRKSGRSGSTSRAGAKGRPAKSPYGNPIGRKGANSVGQGTRTPRKGTRGAKAAHRQRSRS